ncbi:MAG: sulfurtransferase TusA family protein [Alphaproteobacteria bacterium]
MTRDESEAQGSPDRYRLDITNDTCPLTFVKTRLLLERVPAGATIEVRLRAGEPLANVPRSIMELGHEILALEPETDAGDIHRLVIRKAPPPA